MLDNFGFLDPMQMGLFFSIMGVGILCGLLVYEVHMEEDALMSALTLVAIMTS
jgi:hypothetical protein